MRTLRTIFWFCLTLSAVAAVLFPRAGAAVPSGKPAPEIAAEHWINSKPLTINRLRGRVVLVEFWTYG